MKLYTERLSLKITKTQKSTLEKMAERNIKVSKFIREAIKEKIDRETKELRPKQPFIKPPF